MAQFLVARLYEPSSWIHERDEDGEREEVVVVDDDYYLNDDDDDDGEGIINVDYKRWHLVGDIETRVRQNFSLWLPDEKKKNQFEIEPERKVGGSGVEEKEDDKL